MSETIAIAIVDDHVMVRKGLCALINLFPSYGILFDADNGKDMIEKIEEHGLPQIMLLDINMPEMDGYTAARWLRMNHPHTLVLALSTMDSEAAILGMIRQGVKGYLLKDSDPEELKWALDTVLRTGYYCNEIIANKLANSFTNYTSDNNFSEGIVPLSPRELEFLQLSCSEKTYEQIAKEMFVSERTVEGYRESVFKKMNVTSRIGMVVCAIRNQLVVL